MCEEYDYSMEENKSAVNKVQEEIVKNDKKNNKGLFIVIIVLVMLICIFLGYFVGNKLTDEDKEKCSEVVEENKQKEDQKDDKEITTETLLTEEEALKLANDLYSKGITVHSCGGGLDLNYDSVITIEDMEYYEVINWGTLRKLFTTSAKVKGQLGGNDYRIIDDFVEEKDGKYYDMDCGRGSLYGYIGTDFDVVSIKSDIIVFDANSKYCTKDSDYEVNCKTYAVSEPFVIEKEDKEWKISRMIYPNN